MPASSGLFADKAYHHAATETEFKERGSFLVASSTRHRNELESNVPMLSNRLVATMRQPWESLFNGLIQRTDLQNAARVRSRQGLRVQGSWQTRRCVLIAHFLLLIRISLSLINT
jgi:hypothetical protein